MSTKVRAFRETNPIKTGVQNGTCPIPSADLEKKTPEPNLLSIPNGHVGPDFFSLGIERRNFFLYIVTRCHPIAISTDKDR